MALEKSICRPDSGPASVTARSWLARTSAAACVREERSDQAVAASPLRSASDNACTASAGPADPGGGAGGAQAAITPAAKRKKIFFSGRGSPDAHQAADRFGKLLRVVPDAVLEDDFDLLDIVDVFRRVALHHHQVGRLARRDAADLLLLAEEDGAVPGSDLQCLERHEPRIDQQLDLALIAVA